MKRSFFQVAVVSILLYGCTTWMLTKRLEKKLDGNYTRMLRAILNKFSSLHPTKHQLFGHLPPITKTIKVKRTRHAEYAKKEILVVINNSWFNEQFYDMKYSFQIEWFLNRSTWYIDRNLKDTPTTGQSGSGSNGKERVMGFQGKLCCRLLSDSIQTLFNFYPSLSCWCNFLDKKAVKELYERR